MSLSVLLYNGKTGGGDEKRFAIKADSFSVNYVKTPVQIPLPNGVSPQIMDFGFLRPSITITGLVDTDDPSETVTGPDKSGTSYSVPTKEELEDFVTGEVYDISASPLEIMIADGSTVIASYDIAIQQARFDLAPGTEDRHSFSIVCVAKKRSDS